MSIGSEIQQILSNSSQKVFDQKMLKPHHFNSMKDHPAVLFDLLCTKRTNISIKSLDMETILEKPVRLQVAAHIVHNPGTIDSVRGKIMQVIMNNVRCRKICRRLCDI